MKSEYPAGATPLATDETAGLRLTHITTREELNIFEQQNIQQAVAWALGGRKKDIMSEAFIQQLHQRMFGDVWKWAGQYRTSNKNIGVFSGEIGIELHKLINDVKFWVEKESFSPDEIAVRFHHRLVAIHPFANGNGRHARLMTDLLLEKQLRRPKFNWGGATLEQEGSTRSRYIAALRAADQHDYSLLMQFVRS